MCYIGLRIQHRSQNAIPTYWTWDANRWLSIRFDLLSSAVIGLTAFVAVLSPSISAALAGFALAFASSMTHNVCLTLSRFIEFDQVDTDPVAALGPPLR